VQQGAVGRISKCRDGWCHVELDKREGYIRTSEIWGVGEGEVVD
jgi:SH3-like domain-containing protein